LPPDAEPASWTTVVVHVSSRSGPALVTGGTVSAVTVTVSVSLHPFPRSVTRSVYVPPTVATGLGAAGFDSPAIGVHCQA
jgi:hypothetical protein